MIRVRVDARISFSAYSCPNTRSHKPFFVYEQFFLFHFLTQAIKIQLLLSSLPDL